VQLVERAKSLLAHCAPGKSLGELHLQAMKLLVVAGGANVFGKGRFGLGHRCRRARYPSQRGMSAAARAAARRATAPARRCNVGRAARRGTFEHWVATGAPNVASRLLARTFPRGPPSRTLDRMSRSPNEEGPRTAKSISKGNADGCLRGEPVASPRAVKTKMSYDCKRPEVERAQ
jgi:hypothetical protein